MTTTINKRKKISPTVEKQVLIESKRRCCLCYHLNDDLGIKKGQIAHIDHDRSNSGEINLAFMCFSHHDEYDSVNSQSKGFTSYEVKHAKKILYDALRSQIPQKKFRIRVTIEADFDKLSVEERQKLIEKVLKIVGVKGEVRIVNVERGSIRFTLELNSNDAERLSYAFNNGYLDQTGVIDVNPREMPWSITFSNTFEDYSHGILKGEAKKVVMHADNMLFLDDKVQKSSQDSAMCGLYLRKITKKHSILVITAGASEITAALPINHSYLDVPEGADVMETLKRFLVQFGVEMNIDGEKSIMVIGRNLMLPSSITRYEDIIICLRNFVGKNQEKCEMFFMMNTMQVFPCLNMFVILMFMISKYRYYPSLEALGIQTKLGKLGSYLKRVNRKKR